MKRRSGFTLVEMMVAMALTLFIMVILSEAFTVGLETFRLLKATGDMQERLRTVSVILRRDLKADHFPPNMPGVSDTFLSGQNLLDPTWSPPAQGYFRIWQGSSLNS